MVRLVAQRNCTMADDQLCKLFGCLHELLIPLHQSFWLDSSMLCVVYVAWVIVMNLYCIMISIYKSQLYTKSTD